MEKKNAMLTVDVIIPTYHPDEKLNLLLKGLLKQSQPVHQLVLVNTGEPLSNQQGIEKAFAKKGVPVQITNIAPEEFDHGGTRHQAAAGCTGDLLLFMTQDAVPCDTELIANLTKPFEAEHVAAAYARQLPARDCRVIERYTRSFNYPKESRVKDRRDLDELGIKTFFCSNVCAAYRRTVYEQMGGFPVRTIFNEDMIFAGRLVQAGYAIAYAADARVVHSHNYSWRSQFSRNFDLAVSQKQFPEIFGGVKSESEGVKLVKQTARYLVSQKRYGQLPVLIGVSGAKYLGYRLGRCYDRLPRKLVRRLSMNRRYWQQAHSGGPAQDTLVSVCIPAYNSGAYIERTIQSVLNQTHRKLEVVVVDDCSKDNTVQIVEALCQQDARIRLVKNEKNLGMAGNWNACVEHARGEYIKLLCADDILYPQSIEKELAPFLKHPQVNLVMSDTALIDVEEKKVGAFYRWPKKGLMDGPRLARISLLWNNFFGAPCNNLFRKAAAMKVGGFDKNFVYILDFDFWLSLACLGQVYIVHETLNAFRIRRDSNTGDVMGEGSRGQEYMAEHARLVKKHGNGDLGLSPGQQRFSIWWRKTRSRLIHIYLKLFTK